MKKKCSLFLALVLLLTLAGCRTKTVQAATTKIETTAAEVIETVKSTATPTTAAAPAAVRESAAAAPALSQTATVEQTVLYEDERVKITATGLEYGSYSAELGLLLENNSGENLTFLSGTIGYSCNSVNGYMYSSAYLNCDVAAGKKANETLDFDYDELRLYGITELSELAIGIEIENEDYDKVYTGPLTLPVSAADYGFDFAAGIENAANQQEYDYSLLYGAAQSTSVGADLSVLSAYVVQRNDEQTLLLEVENSGTAPIVVGLENIYVNALLACDDVWDYTTVTPGKRAVLQVTLEDLMDSSLYEAFGITAFSRVSLTVAAYNEDYDPLGASAAVDIPIDGQNLSYTAAGREIYNANGLKLSYIAALSDDFAYSDDIHLILLAENTGDRALVVTDIYDSFSVNGFMGDCILYSVQIPAHSSTPMDIQISEYDFEDMGIAAPEDITEAEIGLEIRSADWDKIDETYVTLLP